MLGVAARAMLCFGELTQGNVVPRLYFSCSVIVALLLPVLSGCASTAPEPAPAVVPASELNLNLPEPQASDSDCDCEALAASAENYFDRGVRALAARDYERAVTYFERHRESGSTEAKREADVGLAFVTLLSQKSTTAGEASTEGVDERAEVMILALAAVQALEGQIDALNALNKALSKDLEKREDALKRLRDLTLGQEEGGR